jgi:hypothetical protein
MARDAARKIAACYLQEVVRMRQWPTISVVAVLGLFSAVFATAAIAHSGHPPGDGPSSSRSNIQRIGDVEIEFHPKKGEYTYKRPNEPVIWYHGDRISALEGAHYPLPSSEEEPVICVESGRRIRIMYSTAANPSTPTPEKAAEIRSYVRRMNAKVVSESLRSSDGAKALRMRVDCDATGAIRISSFQHETGEKNSLFTTVDNMFGAPSGSNSVKNLVFYDGTGPDLNIGGWGQHSNSPAKNTLEGGPYGNPSRYQSKSAVVYKCCWSTHVTLHELFHTMGAVSSEAPYSTFNGHCWTGIDVMCYDDDFPNENRVEYTESFCPGPGYYASSIGAPLDCNYDTYFDAVAESGEYLKTAWNVGEPENPFLLTPQYLLRDTNSSGPPNYALSLTPQQTGDLPISGDWNGDGVDTVGFYRPYNGWGLGAFYLRNSKSLGPADLTFTFGITGDLPVAGDWNEDGIDTIGVYRPSNGVFYLRDSNSGGSPQYQFPYGNTGDLPIAGDWNNSGTDTIGLYRPSTGVFYLSDTNASVPPVYSFAYGNPNNDDLPVAGDWDENGYFSVGVYRQSTGEWFLDNEVPGNQPISYAFSFGAIGHTTPIVGDWNNSGTDTPGAVWK